VKPPPAGREVWCESGGKKNGPQENTTQGNYIHGAVQADGAKVLVQAAGAGFSHGQSSKIIAEFSRQNRPETPAQQVHRKKVEGHGGATKAGRNDVMDSGINTGIVRIAEQAAQSHKCTEEKQLPRRQVEGQKDEYRREKQRR